MSEINELTAANPTWELDVDVAIVGLGPVGATFANLLGIRGTRVAAFDRDSNVYPAPRAAHFDGEVMRIFQAIGLADAIALHTTPIDGMDFVNGNGHKLFGFDRVHEERLHGWPNANMFFQPELEAALRAGLERFHDVTVRLGHEVESITERADWVVLQVRNLATGTIGMVRARYAVGCDGARSLTREAIGSQLCDYGFEQPWLVVDTVLHHPVELPAIAVQYCDPARPATFIPIGERRRRWELMLLADETPEAAESRVWELLAPWVGPDDVELERASVYTFHALVARTWRDGRVFLMGDAAHQMPPFLGQGMCAGIRDGANLAWKLDLVARGLAGDPLLETYQSEREPHVRALIETAVEAGRIVQTTDPEVAAARDAKLRAAPDAMSNRPYPMPPLGPGFHAEGTAEPLPQPVRLDERLGHGFALVGPRPRRSLQAEAFWSPRSLTILSTRVLDDWLAARDADFALVRPDRYVFGTGRGTNDLDALTEAARALQAR